MEKLRKISNKILNNIKFSGVLLIVMTLLSACTHNAARARTFDEVLIGGDDTTSVTFNFEQPADFIIADGKSKNPTQLIYRNFTIYDANGAELIGNITDYCDVQKVNSKGDFVKVKDITGTTYRNAEGYYRINNCKMTVQVGVDASFDLDAKENRVISRYVTVLAE